MTGRSPTNSVASAQNFGYNEDSAVGVKIAELFRFNTFKPEDEEISFEEYVDRTMEGQNDIYCITGESIAMVSSSSFLENLRKNGHEVPYMADPVDDSAVRQPKDFDGTKQKPTTKEGLDLRDQDEKKTLEELKIEPVPLRKLMKEALGDKIDAWTPRDDSMHIASGSQQEREERKEKNQKVEGGEWETVVGKRRKKGEREEKRGGQEKVGTLEGKERERDQEGRKKGKEREAEEGGSEQVKKDVTDWVEVKRRTRRKNCKKVQIFVKVDESKVIPMEVSLEDDKVEDVMRQFQKDEDPYVTLHGRVLKRSDKLKSCGATDGCTIQVTNRLRGGGRHKVKKRKESAETERMEHRVDQKDDEVEGVVMDLTQPVEERLEQRWSEDVKGDKTPVMRECDKDAYVQMIEQEEVYRKIVDEMLGYDLGK